MKHVLLLVLTMLLMACAAPVARIEVVQSQTLMLLEPEPQYLEDCGQVVPPDPASYKDLGADEREDALTRLLLQQMNLTQSCTQDKRSLRALIEKQRQLVNQHNAIEAKRVSTLKQTLEKTPWR